MSAKTYDSHRVLGPLGAAGRLHQVRASSLTLPTLLTVCAGYLDTASFLTFHGLFAAHVTGNLVTLGASMVLGKTGAIAKLVALPVFCCVVGLVRLAALWLAEHELSQLRVLLWIEFVLLAAVFVLAAGLGPFPDSDALPAVLTGMMAVAAMAVQNAAQRLHMTGAPPSTLMTGNLTQLMIDTVDLVRSHGAADAHLHQRIVQMLTIIASFASGCGLAVIFFVMTHKWCFAVPLVPAFLAPIVGKDFKETRRHASARQNRR